MCSSRMPRHLCNPAGAISDGGLTPTTDTDLLLATYRGGSYFIFGIYIMEKVIYEV